MTDTTNLNIKVDRELKSQADALFNAMGMTLTTAINVFIRQAVQDQAIPFQIRLDKKEQFHKLLDTMRNTASERGFMSDEQINTEIAAARIEIKKQSATA